MSTRLHLIRAVLAAGAIALSPTLAALSPPPPLPVEVLEDFYEAMNGDDWHRNDGWLDPEVDVCDWYGISCVTEGEEFGGFEWIGYIRLQNNNLRGEFSAELLERMWTYDPAPTPSLELDLHGNEIEGALHRLPLRIRRVGLGYNNFEGELPAVEAGADPSSLERLHLNNNGFEGQVPASWEALSLVRLDLSNNVLEGPAEPAFDALDPAEANLIDLSDNAFAGELPAWITELPLESDFFGGIGTINICWTDLSVPNQAMRDWLAERYVGGADFESCLDRERRAIGPEASGSWFDPQRSGEGFSLMVLENGVPLIYWFTHLSLSRQMWLVGTGKHEDTTLFFPDLLETEGRFRHGHGSVGDPVSRKGEQRMDGVADERLHWQTRINYYLGELTQPDDGPIVFGPNPIDYRTDLVRLSELAGTTCDNQSEFQQYSGAWYNPERAGEGFIVEVLPDDQAVVYWFTYQPDESGRQAWMIGQDEITAVDDINATPGEHPEAKIITEAMIQPVDAGQSFPADLSGVEMLDWGEIHISFDDAERGGVYFESELEGYGSGSYPIKRLARPMLAECEGDSSQNR